MKKKKTEVAFRLLVLGTLLCITLFTLLTLPSALSRYEESREGLKTTQVEKERIESLLTDTRETLLKRKHRVGEKEEVQEGVQKIVLRGDETHSNTENVFTGEDNTFKVISQR